MSTFDYVFPLLLILSVLRQIRGRRLTWFQLLWPIGVVVWAAIDYVRGFPATTADVILVASAAVLGGVLGALAGHCTGIYRRADGALMARATLATVILWTLGTIGRLAFGLYAEHGGGRTIASFSAAHGLAFNAWAAALTLMALAEVLGRTTILGPRAARAARRPAVSADCGTHSQQATTGLASGHPLIAPASSLGRHDVAPDAVPAPDANERGDAEASGELRLAAALTQAHTARRLRCGRAGTSASAWLGGGAAAGRSRLQRRRRGSLRPRVTSELSRRRERASRRW